MFKFQVFSLLIMSPCEVKPLWFLSQMLLGFIFLVLILMVPWVPVVKSAPLPSHCLPCSSLLGMVSGIRFPIMSLPFLLDVASSLPLAVESLFCQSSCHFWGCLH